MLRTSMLGLVVGAISVAGCAKRPDAITPATVPVSAYENMSCTELAAELSRERAALNEASKAQNRAATADAVGVFLVLVPAGSVTGNDNEGKVAELKGKIISIEAMVKNKGC